MVSHSEKKYPEIVGGSIISMYWRVANWAWLIHGVPLRAQIHGNLFVHVGKKGAVKNLERYGAGAFNICQSISIIRKIIKIA